MHIPTETLELLTKVRSLLSSHGAEGYLIGGAVRDLFVPRETADIDIATSGNTSKLAEALADALHGRLVVLDDQRNVYRIVLLANRHHIDLNALQGDLRQDILRRDFTINTLAIPLKHIDNPALDSHVIDLVGGVDDIKGHRIHLVSDNAFQEDPLRLLRAVRLAAELGFTIDATTEAALNRDAYRITTVAGERTRDEFFRILGHPSAAERLQQLDHYGLLTTIIPELEEARNCGQPKEHYWDVLQHSIQIVDYTERVIRQVPSRESYMSRIPWEDTYANYFSEEISGGRTRLVLLKLSALLHDVAKPTTKTVEATGRIRFFGHPKVGSDISQNIMERLKLSNRESRIVVSTILEHLRPGLISKEPGGPTKRAIYRFYRDAGEAAVDTLFLSYADYLAARGPLLEQQDWEQYSGRISGILKAWRQVSPVAKPKLINGHDLIKELSISPSPRLRVLLESLHEAEATGEVTTYAEALALAKRLVRQGIQ